MSPLMMKLLGRVYMNEVQGDGGQGGGGDAPAAPPAPTAAPAAAAEGSVLTPPAPAAAPAPDEVKTPEQIQQEADAAAKLKAETNAPEAYEDFTLPEGMEMDGEILESFKGLAKELNIPQAKAQQLIDFQTQLATKQAEQYQAAVVKQGQDWAAAIKNDPDVGGDNYDKSVAGAVKVIEAFGDPSLKELLNTSGLGNHPALFKFCHRISAAISEDKFVMPGSQTETPKEMSIIDAFK